MKNNKYSEINMSEDLKNCVLFHGHLCPGLVYGYIVANEAINLLELKRSKDEEVVAISENDSCAVDALQVMLGTTAGKGNLLIKDYGKNVYTILKRSDKKAYRFSRKKHYSYQGKNKKEFALLDNAVSAGKATELEKLRLKMMKTKDLLSKPATDLFTTKEIEYIVPPYAPLARSEQCTKCGEMTMSTKMISSKQYGLVCIPCSKAS